VVGSIMGFVVIRRIFFTVNGCLNKRTGQIPLICETEPSDINSGRPLMYLAAITKTKTA